MMATKDKRNQKQVRLLFQSALILLLLPTWVLGQTSHPIYPKVGDTVINYTFSDLINSEKKTVSVNEYRGKWLILDFWATTCGGCLASFKKMDSLDKEFRNSVKLIMVGLTNEKVVQQSLARTKAVYERMNKKDTLGFTVAFDSPSGDLYQVQGIPMIFIINPQGILIAKTNSVNAKQLRLLLTGGKPKFMPAYSRDEPERLDYDYKFPLLTSGENANGGSDTSFLYRSAFSRWQPGMPEYIKYGFKNCFNEKYFGKYKNRAEIFGFSLPNMIRMACTGWDGYSTNLPLFDSLYHTIIIEAKDKKIFNKYASGNTYENSFCYSLECAGLTPDLAQKHLLSDLQKAFNLNISIKTRNVPVLSLVVVNQMKAKRLKTKGGKPLVKGINNRDFDDGYILQNFDLNDLVKGSILRIALTGPGSEYDGRIYDVPPIRNDTGINYNVDLTLKGYDMDFKAIKKSLNESGLDLVKIIKPFRCIVVDDI